MTEDISAVIAQLRKQATDDARFEAKECARGLSADVWESVSAFGNTEGGMLILGLSESQGFVPVSGFEIGKVRDQFIGGMGDGGQKGRLTNPPRYAILRVDFEGAPLLLVKIEELPLSHKPCYITERGVQRGSFKRVDDADIPLSPNEVYLLDTADTITDSDRLVVQGATTADLSVEVLSAAFEKAQQVAPRSLRGAADISEKMKRLSFTDNGGSVTKAGLLTAGVYPQQFFPKLLVDVAVHPGIDKGGRGKNRFLDRMICEGTLGEMIEDSVACVSRNLRRVSVVKGVGRFDELEIPEEVLREAITNALVHREYDGRFDGQAVCVDVFSDRVEVVSPGGLWGKTRDRLADGRSCCRNATLMKLMSFIPLPGGAGTPAEGNGSGIPFMVSESLRHGLQPPTFCPAIDHFKVILHRPAEGPSGVSGTTLNGEALVRALLDEHGELSVRELSEKSGLSVNQVRSRVRKLLADAEIVATAPETSKNRRYRVKR